MRNFHFLLLAPALLLTACVSSNYSVERVDLPHLQVASGTSREENPQPAKNNTGQQQENNQRLIYSLSPDWDRDPPVCAVIRPADEVSAGSVIAADVEQAVTIHMGGKMDRVIGAQQRNRILRKQKLDLDHPGDARTFAYSTRCRAILTWKLTAASETFLLAWGTRNVGLELTLRRIGQKDILWQARHAVSRSDGGLPLSPVGLVLDTVRAGRFMGDRDMLASMIHDVVRRLFTTLPDTI